MQTHTHTVLNPAATIISFGRFSILFCCVLCYHLYCLFSYAFQFVPIFIFLKFISSTMQPWPRMQSNSSSSSSSTFWLYIVILSFVRRCFFAFANIIGRWLRSEQYVRVSASVWLQLHQPHPNRIVLSKNFSHIISRYYAISILPYIPTILVTNTSA